MADIIALMKAKAAVDPQLRSVLKRVGKGTAGFKDTAEYSVQFAHLLGRTLSDNVLDIPADVREAVTEELLRYGYDDMNTILAEVQKSLDEQAGIHIRPQKADFPSERVQQFAHSLIDPTVEDSIIKRRAKAGSETITKSFHDGFIKKNAQFRNDAGLKCYITREAVGGCCEWCSEVAGRYEFGSQPSDIFRRHDNCDCTIDYDGQKLRGKLNADGSRSKTWEEVPDADGSYEPKVLSGADARAAEQRNLSQLRGVKINSSSIDNGRGSGIITSRGSGNGDSKSEWHPFERIGEIDFNDKRAVAKSLQEFEQKYKKSRIEHCRVICKNGEIYDVHGDLDTVNTGGLGKLMNGSINEHNHVTGRSQYSFSFDDLEAFVDDGTSIALAYDEKYRYSMIFPDKQIDSDTAYEAKMKARQIVYDKIIEGSNITSEQLQHEMITEACKILGIKYERVSL